MSDLLQQIVGERLSAVTFVQDYLQLQFDGPILNALTVVTVATAQGRARSGDDQFGNLLCSCITKRVSQVEVMEREALSICFADSLSTTTILHGQRQLKITSVAG